MAGDIVVHEFTQLVKMIVVVLEGESTERSSIAKNLKIVKLFVVTICRNMNYISINFLIIGTHVSTKASALANEPFIRLLSIFNL